MTRSKLSDTDKQEVVALYRESAETMTTLAERYGVSSTTIRRILKGNLSQQEYDLLTNQKQTPRLAEPEQGPSRSTDPAEPVQAGSIEGVTGTLGYSSPSAAETSESSSLKPATRASEQNTEALVTKKTLPKRSLATSHPSISSDSQAEVPEISMNLPVDPATGGETRAAEPEPVNVGNFDSLNLFDTDDSIADYEDLGEELDSDLDDLDSQDYEEEDLETEAQDFPGARGLSVGSYPHSETPVHVLPLREAAFPKTCYLVVDRFAELITRPLKDFGDLGNIPLEEVQERTLPIFENHRVARRFSNRTQRVIKIPDGNMLQKTCFHLYSKGITRLLINGQVYSL